LATLPDWRRGTRLNDGKSHTDGSSRAGSVTEDQSPAGVLWRLAPDGLLRPILGWDPPVKRGWVESGWTDLLLR
jgi:hypothetical protein